MSLSTWLFRRARSAVRWLGGLATGAFPAGSPAYRVIQRLSHALPASVRGPYRRDSVTTALAGFAERRERVTFLQVGSHAGGEGDPIGPYVTRDRWTGVLVEPVPEIFARLRARYGEHPGLAFERAAVAECDGRATFWTVAEEATAHYAMADQLGSLDRDVVLSHASAFPDIADYLVRTVVPCLTFESLLLRHDLFDRLDVLHLDTEGMDGILLASFPWHRCRPRLVLYEHKHLEPEARAEARRLLARQGYEIVSASSDTLARLPEDRT